uniref:Uncharacterized protein n=1 Tax=viral metagenome TaxID=1070528 RepID=A0A2V0RJ38_9ZZZZ
MKQLLSKEGEEAFLSLEKQISQAFKKGDSPTLYLYDTDGESETQIASITLQRKSNRGFRLYDVDGKRFRVFSWLKKVNKQFPLVDEVVLDLGALDVTFDLDDKFIGLKFNVAEFVTKWNKRRVAKGKRPFKIPGGSEVKLDIFTKRNKF